jgi:hypothetical protein
VARVLTCSAGCLFRIIAVIPIQVDQVHDIDTAEGSTRIPVESNSFMIETIRRRGDITLTLVVL